MGGHISLHLVDTLVDYKSKCWLTISQYVGPVFVNMLVDMADMSTDLSADSVGQSVSW